MKPRILVIAAVMLTNVTGTPALATPPPVAFVYCSAASASPRGPGLIISAIFRSRSDPAFIEAAFTNYLRGSYAPYGNGWTVPERSPACRSFSEQGDAETQRNLDISRVPQPEQTVFNVTFQIG